MDNRLGYVAIDNRVCVALSRARDGFYVIGNFDFFAARNETWKFIVNRIAQLKLIGPGLPVQCNNHPSNQLVCVRPDDFLKRPLGGCGLKCEHRLSCGHQCQLVCHNTSHDRFICRKPCLRNYDDCEHRCEKICHSSSECLPCSEMVTLKMPHCEHTCDIACFMRKTNKLDCAQLVPFTCSHGHQVQVRCYDLRNTQAPDELCNHPCDSMLVSSVEGWMIS